MYWRKCHSTGLWLLRWRSRVRSLDMANICNNHTDICRCLCILVSSHRGLINQYPPEDRWVLYIQFYFCYFIDFLFIFPVISDTILTWIDMYINIVWVLMCVIVLYVTVIMIFMFEDLCCVCLLIEITINLKLFCQLLPLWFLVISDVLFSVSDAL